MLSNLFLLLSHVKTDISNDLYIALEKQKMGKIDETRLFFESNLSAYYNNDGFIRNYIKFLISIGNYEEVIKRYGHLNDELIQKAREYNDIMNTKNYKKISQLINVSEYSCKVLEAVIKLHLIENNLEKANAYLRKALRLFPEDIGVKKLHAQYSCVKGEYIMGMNILHEIGYSKSAMQLQELINQFEDIKNVNYIDDKLTKYRRLYSTINAMTMSDSFSPSIFAGILYDVLHKYVQIGVENKKENLTSMGRTLYNMRTNELTRYLYILALIYDKNIDRARQEFMAKDFINNKYRRTIEAALEIHKRQMEEEKERQRKKQRQYEEERMPKTEKAGTDFLGYYKILGVNRNNTEKEIKKAYAKIVAKNGKMKKNQKQKEEWEKKFLKINKAVQTLTNEKKRRLYDNGIDPESPQAQYANQQQYHEHQGYQKVADFGPFSQFFESFGGSGGGFRRGRTTYYAYF